MCGRAYSTYTDEELRHRYSSSKPIQMPSIYPNYNFAPSQEGLVVRKQEGEIQFDLFRWGLIPSWAKEEKIGFKLINARSESIQEKSSFKEAFKKRRCIVPVSGFFEWQREGGTKRAYCI